MEKKERFWEDPGKGIDQDDPPEVVVTSVGRGKKKDLVVCKEGGIAATMTCAEEGGGNARAYTKKKIARLY